MRVKRGREKIQMSDNFEYKCPCCGGKIEFDATLQTMKCPYCASEFDVEAVEQFDEKTKAGNTDNMSLEIKSEEWEDQGDLAKYSCKSCGGEIITTETQSATHCPYCGNPVILAGNLRGELKPDLVIPFKLEKSEVKKKYEEHTKGKRLLPDVFVSKNHIDEIKGVYVPFWVFDAESDVQMSLKGTKTRSWSSGDYRYTETSYFGLERDASMAFRDIPEDGSSQMPDALMESIEPFDMKQAVDFKTAYLSGYLADKYDVGEADMLERAKQRVRRSVEDEIRKTCTGYATLNVDSSNIASKCGKAKYVLFPVWLLSTTYEGKNYLFAMNGQTGKFVGDLPVCKQKKNRLFASTFAIAMAVIVVFGKLIGVL